jgi:hypothetical protein
LQAAKRKHFKNEDKRMNYDDELKLKQRLMVKHYFFKQLFDLRAIVEENWEGKK